MTTPSQAYRNAANSPAGRHAAEAAKEARDSVKSAAHSAKETAEEVGEFDRRSGERVCLRRIAQGRRVCV